MYSCDQKRNEENIESNKDMEGVAMGVKAAAFDWRICDVQSIKAHFCSLSNKVGIIY
jgi:hypothetical protein